MNTESTEPNYKQYSRLLIRYLRPQVKQVALLAGLIVTGITLQLINPQLVRRFLDAAEAQRDVMELVETAVLFMVIAILAQGLRLAATYVGELVAWTATNALRADLALHCLRLDMAFHKQHKPGELIERVDGDVNQLATFFSQLVIQLFSNLLLIGGVLVLLWVVDWRVGASIAAIGAVGLWSLGRLNRRIVPLWQKVRAVSADLFGSLEEWLNGVAEIQTSGAGSYILRRLYRVQRRRWRTMVGAMRVNYLLMAWPILIPTLAYVAAYIWGARLFQNETLTIGAVYLIFYYIDTIKSPLYAVRQQMQEMQRAAASLNRIVALFAEQPTMHDGPVTALPPRPLAVEFRDVTFRYEADEAPVLRGVDFRLAPGRTLGLLGRTGSGKTTISRLLFRFYDPTQGEIRLGDGNGEMIPLPRLSQAAIRERVGMVTQDVELFHATVRDNLTLFDEGIEDGRIHAALAELGLDSWLAQLPDGLDTKLEGSDNLSAGEAQLLALARVFLRDPGLVILDEASSRLDPATEYLIERAIERLLHGRTAIIIAHRLTTVARADEIMVLGGGEILEHDERVTLAGDPDSHFSRLLQTGATLRESGEMVHG